MSLHPATLCAAIVGGSLLASPAAAAPDQTQGVAQLFAAVRFDGLLFDGAGAVSTQRITVGRYNIVFNRPVDDCSFLASTGVVSPVSGPPSFGVANVAPLAGQANAVTVGTYNADGNLQDKTYYLMVFCAR